MIYGNTKTHRSCSWTKEIEGFQTFCPYLTTDREPYLFSFIFMWVVWSLRCRDTELLLDFAMINNARFIPAVPHARKIAHFQQIHIISQMWKKFYYANFVGKKKTELTLLVFDLKKTKECWFEYRIIRYADIQNLNCYGQQV